MSKGKMRFIILLAGLVFVLSSGCSTAKVRVMPGEGGVNRVVSRDIHKEGAEEAALDGANDYCKKNKKTAIFIKDHTQYTGSMDENTRKTVKNASNAAMILGGAGAVGSSTRAAGGMLGAAGTVGHAMTNDRDYTSQLEFKCQ